MNEIMTIMNEIEYGFKDNKGNNILDVNPKKWDEEFYQFYFLQTPEELLKSKCGVCWDQVELERVLIEKQLKNVKTYFIYTVDNENLPSHTFLTYKYKNKYYWFEHSWFKYRGIHEYESELDLLKDVKQKFLKDNNYVSEDSFTFIYEYQKPTYHIKCEEFYKYIETQKLIKINEPLYFYHVVDKNADMSKGLLSLKYMYDNKIYNLFDKNVLKYKTRITNDWNIEKYKGKENLTREDYIQAINTFRGIYGTSYIYFFRYAPYKELGNKIKELLKYKDIYRININDEELQKQILDINYGYDKSNTNNKKLNKKYYENITKEEYFKNYDDNLKMNFSTLNHIGIAFKNNYCDIKYLEKITYN